MKFLLRIGLPATTFLFLTPLATPQDTRTVRVEAPYPRDSVVTGAPYSAEQVYEHVQTLADGTRITQKPRSTLEYRDSQGRMRIESTYLGETKTVQIHDLVTGFRYLLDTQSHIAHRFAPPAEKKINGDTSAANPVVARGASAIPDPAKRPQTTTESLDSQTIEGVFAEGKRTTTTIPVGLMGNDRPIVRVMEIWTSPDLKILLLAKTLDPRTGEGTNRIQNLSRAEPDPALFMVPADYKIVDDTGEQVEIRVANP